MVPNHPWSHHGPYPPKVPPWPLLLRVPPWFLSGTHHGPSPPRVPPWSLSSPDPTMVPLLPDTTITDIQFMYVNRTEITARHCHPDTSKVYQRLRHISCGTKARPLGLATNVSVPIVILWPQWPLWSHHPPPPLHTQQIYPTTQPPTNVTLRHG